MAEGAASSGGRPEEKERAILIVDDDDATRLLLRATIEGLCTPCRIYEAADGDTALAMAGRARPDLALIDIVLPGSTASGVLVCEHLCKDPRTKVVVISGQANESIVQAALSAGAVAYVRKPFSVEEIRAKIATWLSD
jgi:sigma-B regulation protein RsbU (phosphoserine phosphatase)